MQKNIPNRIRKAIKKYKLNNEKPTKYNTIEIHNTKDFNYINHSHTYILYKKDINKFALHNHYVTSSYEHKVREYNNPTYAPEFYIILENHGINGWKNLIDICEYNDECIINKMCGINLCLLNETYKITPFSDLEKYIFKNKTVIFFNHYGYNYKTHIKIKYYDNSKNICEKKVKSINCKY